MMMAAKLAGYRNVILSLLLFAVLLVSGCLRGNSSDEPPIHPNPNMDDQEKYKPQTTGLFFADSSSMRIPDRGTVARGQLRDDDAYFKGVDSRGNYIENAPVVVTKKLIERGRERYDIYCSPCHSRIGDGRGIMVKHGYIPPPSFHTDRIRELSDGEIYHVITNGVRNMPAYNHQVNPDDRWAIVMYIRALQRSQNATIEDVPQELRETVKNEN